MQRATDLIIESYGGGHFEVRRARPAQHNNHKTIWVSVCNDSDRAHWQCVCSEHGQRQKKKVNQAAIDYSISAEERAIRCDDDNGGEEGNERAEQNRTILDWQ